MKTVKDCNDASVMSHARWYCRRTSLLCLYLEVFLFHEEQPYPIKTYKPTNSELRIAAFSAVIRNHKLPLFIKTLRGHVSKYVA